MTVTTEKPLIECKLIFQEEDSEAEDQSDYCEGGYHSVQIGELFNNRYHVIHKLGWGTYSTVWLCWDQKNKRYVAVKISKSEDAYSEVAEDEIKFFKYIRNSKDPRREKIVRLLDDFKLTGVNGVHICTVFEIMGNSLEKMVTLPLPLPLQQVKIVIKQVLEALDYLHTKCKIIHCDVKLDNILLCVDGNDINEFAKKVGFQPPMKKENLLLKLLRKLKNKTKYLLKILRKLKIEPETKNQNPNPVNDLKIKLGDLGTASWSDNHFNRMIQSRPYRCPEVILGAKYGPPVDIWSTACMAVALATGENLFEPGSAENLFVDQVHLAQMIELFGDVPKHIAFSGQNSKMLFANDGKLRQYEVKPYGLLNYFFKEYDFGKNEAREFVDFLLPMFEFDQEKRITTRDCISHPWLQC